MNDSDPHATRDCERPKDEHSKRKYGVLFIALLPNVFRAYERLCVCVATRDVHNLAYFASTAFCGPVGIYVWEERNGWFVRRATLGYWTALFVLAGLVLSWPAGSPRPLFISFVPMIIFAPGMLGVFVRRALVGLIAWGVLVLGVIFFLNGFKVMPAGLVIGVIALAASRPLRWLFKFLGLHRQRPDPDIPKMFTFEFTTLDIVSLVFVACIFLVMLVNRDALLSMGIVTNADPAYHMAVARQIIEHQWVVPTWDQWEYAPYGRPHLYPPLLHYMIAVCAGEVGNVEFGFNTIQILLYPMALLAAWYFARWLFGAAVGFASTVFLSMDAGYLLTHVMAVPSAIVTALIPVILLAFMTRKPKTSISLLTAALYTHGPVGVPEFMVLGLLVFCMKYRSYVPLFRKVVAFSFFFYLPWLVHVIRFHEWLGTASQAMGAENAIELIVKSVLQYQIVSPILLVVAILGWRREKGERSVAVKSLLIGFLPMLFYGGRYLMHTWGLWAILAGCYMQEWIDRAVRYAGGIGEKGAPSLGIRVGLMVFFAFLPLPVIINGFGLGTILIPGPTAANSLAAVRFMRSDSDHAFEAMAQFIRDTVDLGQIVHIGMIVADGRRAWGSMYFGDRIVYATGCRVDTGAWEDEVRRAQMMDEVVLVRDSDPRGLFAFKKGSAFTEEDIEYVKARHRLGWVRRFGECYLVGGRGLYRTSRSQPPGKPLNITGTSG